MATKSADALAAAKGSASDEGLRWTLGEAKSTDALAAAALPAAAVSATRAALSRDANNAGEALPRAADALIAVFDFFD